MREVYLIENAKDMVNLFLIDIKEQKKRKFKPEIKLEKLKQGIFGEIDGKQIIMKYDWRKNGSKR